MALALVEMTHEDLPGVEKTVSIVAYRGAYYAQGWRSADDPDFTGDSATPPPPSVPVHAATVIDSGLHGVVERNWTQDGVADLTRSVMTQDSSNGTSVSVSAGYLRIAATGSGGNQRDAWIIPDTTAENSEITSLLGQSTTLASGDAQWWHLHRVLFDEDANLWRAWAVWTDTTIPVPTLLNFGVVTWSGAASMNINNAGNSPLENALSVLRYLSVVRAQRASNVVTCWTPQAWLPRVGDTGTLTGMATSAFNASSVAVTAVDRSLGTFAFAQTAANATDADAGGQWQPATVTATIPTMLSTRLVGSTLAAKQWRPEEPEPDWTHPFRVSSYTISSGTPAPFSGEGACAVAAAHLQSPNVLRFGGVRVRKL